MGRNKNFSRSEVIENIIPLFWKQGFADTSMQDIEKASGVNKSGLYTEFKDKDDLYLSSLKHYLESNGVLELLNHEPLGWANIENFLKKAHTCSGQKGCFAVNSVREIAVLPSKARGIIAHHIAKVADLIEANVQAANPKANPKALCEMILTFNSGLCLEQNMGIKESDVLRKISSFLSLLKDH